MVLPLAIDANLVTNPCNPSICLRSIQVEATKPFKGENYEYDSFLSI